APGAVSEAPERMAAPARPAGLRPPEEGEKIVALFVVAPRGQRFRGAEVTRALTDAGLQFGAMDIYHRYPRGDDGAEPVFSVANLVDPGTLNPAAMDDFATPGLSLFMRLPGPMTGRKALDDLIATAQRLADNLDGELRDRTRSVLSRQTIEALREEVVEFERRASIHHA
ncbi:MAG: cell division protein ZipA, partial [Gammaproteobacteria bacterium]